MKEKFIEIEKEIELFNLKKAYYKKGYINYQKELIKILNKEAPIKSDEINTTILASLEGNIITHIKTIDVKQLQSQGISLKIIKQIYSNGWAKKHKIKPEICSDPILRLGINHFNIKYVYTYFTEDDRSPIGQILITSCKEKNYYD